MIKKFFTLCVLAATVFSASAEESESMKAFHHMGVGVEAGLMGVGVEVSMPIVTNHLVFVAGYNWYNIKGLNLINRDFEFPSKDFNNQIDKFFDDNQLFIDEYNQQNPGDQFTRDNTKLPGDVSINAKLRLNGNLKLLLEYYPSKKSTFHFTGGIMWGGVQFIKLEGIADEVMQNRYTRARQVQSYLQKNGMIAADDDLLAQTLSYSVDGETFSIGADRLAVDFQVTMERIKPYLGIGWGRAVPKRRVGFQFEIGAWYHTGLGFDSSCKVPYNKYVDSNDDVDDIAKLIKDIPVMPQITFRLTGRLF